MKLITNILDNQIVLEEKKVGSDLNILIYGGSIPHIGAVAVATYGCLAHQIEHFTTTVSLITLPGHKEDLLARSAAEIISKKLKKNVVVCCGIHIQNISKEEIKNISIVVENLIKEYLEADRE